MRRYAFTLIELVFAIVVISISVISLPMMNQVISKGLDENIVQEAIFAASAELNQALSYRWDENSVEPNETVSKVIDDGSVGADACNATTRLKPGHIDQPLHRKCLNSAVTRPTPTALLGNEAGEMVDDDLDDAIHGSTSLFVGGDHTKEGYKKAYDSNISVSYAAFADITAASQNMKKITIQVSDADSGNLVTQLDVYSANIGAIDYEKRVY